MNPVSGGSPPRERVANIINLILIGDSWAVIFRCPKVDMLRNSIAKNIEVLIIR